MLKVIAQHYIRPECLDQARPLLAELVEKSRAEALCIGYDLFTNQADPCHFVFVEEWPDRAALDLHAQTEHFTRIVPQLKDLTSREGSLLLMDAFA